MAGKKSGWRIAAAVALLANLFVVVMTFRKPRPEKIPQLARRFSPSLNLVRATTLERLPLATRFDMPIGTERGAMAYNAQFFGEWNPQFEACHLGDDLNGIGGQDTDLGDPIYAIGNGEVIWAGWAGEGWGKVIIVMHAIERDGRRTYVQSFYGHLEGIATELGATVRRGEMIGSIGTAEGRYLAHLHLELREFVTTHIGAGYRVEDLRGWLSPSQFIEQHRGASDDDLSAEFRAKKSATISGRALKL